MKIKKLLLGVLLVVLIGFILSIYNEFNGNPLSKYLAKHELEEYLAQKYPEKELRIKEGFYNFKFSEYQYSVVEIGTADGKGKAKEYQFKVKGFFNPEVRSDGIYYANLDHDLAERISQSAEEEISSMLADQVENIKVVDVLVEVLEGKYQDDIKWSKNLELEKPIEIFVKLDSTEQNEKEFIETVRKIKRILDKQGYAYSSININGNGFDMEGYKAQLHGYLKYSLEVLKDGAVKMSNVEEHNNHLEKD